MDLAAVVAAADVVAFSGECEGEEGAAGVEVWVCGAPEMADAGGAGFVAEEGEGGVGGVFGACGGVVGVGGVEHGGGDLQGWWWGVGDGFGGVETMVMVSSGGKEGEEVGGETGYSWLEHRCGS